MLGELRGPSLATYQATAPAERDGSRILALVWTFELNLPGRKIDDQLSELVRVARPAWPLGHGRSMAHPAIMRKRVRKKLDRVIRDFGIKALGDIEPSEKENRRVRAALATLRKAGLISN